MGSDPNRANRAVCAIPGGDVEQVFREVYGQVIATLVRTFGDITLAEDAAQDAFAIAIERWRSDGIPPNPAGWIVTTAQHRAIDDLRRSTRGRQLEQQIHTSTDPGVAGAIGDEPTEVDHPVDDDRLRLIFTCCHPALRTEHQVALTLRLLGGLSVDEVARSFLVSESAMARRLGRAKYKIKAANIPYRVPADADLPERLNSVLSVIYLVYNTGAEDPTERAGLRDEAIRLARALAELMPDAPEAAGLLALLVLNESRVAARAADGELVLLADQDRSKWDRDLISEGQSIVRACIRRDRPGTFQLQAAIQAVHCDATTFEATDWAQIATLYDHLYAVAPTAVVALNRAIAVGETEGPDVALTEIESIRSDLDGYHLMHATRANMLRRLERRDDAIRAYHRAADLATTEADRRFLKDQVEDLMQ